MIRTMDDILAENALTMAGTVAKMDPRLRVLDLSEIQSECLIEIAKALLRPSHRRPGIRRADKYSPPYGRYETFAFVRPTLTIDEETFPKIFRHVAQNTRDKLLRQLGYTQRRIKDPDGRMRRQPWRSPITQSLPENL